MAADVDNAVGAAPTEPASPPNQQVSGELAAGHRTLAAVGRVYLPTLVIAGCAAWLAWYGWTVLSDYGPARSIRAGQFELAGPAVLGFVLVVFLIEQARPAERRAV
jgi:TRAP-type C4-dicarboxylate transport system permease small subunit